MSGYGKRRRSLEEEESSIQGASNPALASPSKKARKETNASARRSLFVRSLPAVATKEALTELFSQSYPLKHATVVVDNVTKQSKGYGFVTFADSEDAQKALDEFNGKSFKGRKMKIEIAEPRSREKKLKVDANGIVKSIVSVEAAFAKNARQEKMVEDRKPPKLIIRNLPWSIKTPEQLASLFDKFGKVKHSTLPKVKDTQAGFGFVVMRGRKNAEKALAAINGNMVDGRELAVDWAVEKEVWEGQKVSAEADVENGRSEESEGEAPIQNKVDRDSEDEDDDVANFIKDFGEQLESEDDSEENEPDLSGDDEIDDAVEDSGEMQHSESFQMEEKPQKTLITDYSTTLFVRNLPFTTLDADLKEHFSQFGPVRYARVVMDRATDRPRGTGFICFFNVGDADACFRNAPRHQPTGANAIAPKVKHSLLENEGLDKDGLYTLDGRVMQIARAVEREKAVSLTVQGTSFRDNRDKDKRKLYLLSEGTVASGTPLYESLAPLEIKMREDSAIQRKKLIQNNPTLHLSLTRLSIRNLPRNINSKNLKALAREAVVGFAKDVKSGHRAQLSKEEEARGGDEMREAEKQRRAKGKGIVRQAKIVFEGREGTKISEDSGAGRSRGYGFVEYSSHRWALMGLRWLNGHALASSAGKKQRLIVEFAIENAQVVARRKEKEAKARIRSKEVLEAREKGEAPAKEKKVFCKDTLMKKTRVGTKAGAEGRPVIISGKGKLSVKRGQNQNRPEGNKRKLDDDKVEGNKRANPGTASNLKTATSEEERVARRAQIIQKKRMMRRSRKQGGP